MKCEAITQAKHLSQQHWVKQCENDATFRYDGIPLCGTHINKLPERVVTTPVFGFGTVEKL